MATLVVRLARNALVIALFFGAALLGTVSGVLFAFTDDLPQISALDNYAPSTITRVYARDGEVIGEFATERREVIGYDQISPHLRAAIIAAEDERFFQHFGLSVPRILVALFRDVVEQRKAAGASTLTQQLARNLFLTLEKTWERKIKEALLAIQIEKRYTKQEIFTLYANQIYWGHGAYGVEAASRLYFGKSARDLSLEEAAMIAGIVQLPSRQSPYVDLARARQRRNYALSRMAEVGYITHEQAEAAKARPIVTVGPPTSGALAPYFVEEVRKDLEQRYGAKALYENGLNVYTTLDLRLQRAAARALAEGLRQVDKRRGFRKPSRNLADEGTDVESFRDPRWRQPIGEGDVVPAVVTKVEAALVEVRAGALRLEIPRAGYAWTRRSGLVGALRPGDLVQARVVKAAADQAPAVGDLEQEPVVEGAVVAVDNRSGRVLAMVGGYDFERSKFNRAVQAMRQLGSTFKPMVYATAIDRGYTPVSVLVDQPVSYSVGPGQPLYSPTNYDNTYEGPVTLRHALEHSRNVPAVRLMDELGPAHVVEYAHRLGLSSPLQPYLSTALGAGEATLLEITSVYSVFPDQGVRMKPYQVTKVTDRTGSVLEDNRPEPTEAIRADTAFVMTNLLQGVVQRGTAARAASLHWPLGGKTGTTNDYTDAWFVGFDPDITVGVWVGFDQKRPLGPRETGAQAALPIWMEIMKAWVDGRTDPPSFTQPDNVVVVAVDRASGSAAPADAAGAIPEVFISGTQPGGAFRTPQ